MPNPLGLLDSQLMSFCFTPVFFLLRCGCSVGYSDVQYSDVNTQLGPELEDRQWGLGILTWDVLLLFSQLLFLKIYLDMCELWIIGA